jgi:hypothetical protein
VVMGPLHKMFTICVLRFCTMNSMQPRTHHRKRDKLLVLKLGDGCMGVFTIVLSLHSCVFLITQNRDLKTQKDVCNTKERS